VFPSGLNSPADANGKGTITPVASLYYGHLSANVAAGAVEDLVGMSMLGSRESIVGVTRDTIMRVRHSWGTRLGRKRMLGIMYTECVMGCTGTPYVDIITNAYNTCVYICLPAIGVVSRGFLRRCK